jgi:hypothetical protein
MERLFSPCTRFRDILESQARLERLRIHGCEQTQELNLDVSTEEFISAERAFTYADLYAVLRSGDIIAWLTPHTAVVRRHGEAEHVWSQLDESCGFCCSVDGADIVVVALSPEHLSELSDVVLRLLAVCVVHSVLIHEWSPDGTLINAPVLAYLMKQCQSLKVLTLEDLKMDENHCRVLGEYSTPGLEIELGSCKITSAGASALTEVLGRNQGPTKLSLCKIDNLFLTNGLGRNSRLKSLRPRFSSTPEVSNREVLAIAGALRENKGLVDLALNLSYGLSDETWGAISDSLKAHPSLEVLNLRATRWGFTTAPAVLKSRIQALVDMMKENMSIHTIYLDDYYYVHTLFKESVVPYLETNRLRPRLLAIQKTIPHAYRAKVLERALVAVRTDPNRFWMLLSGNSEVAFPSTNVTASLPAPANAAATENVAPVAANAIATASAASSVVASAAGQKRKAWP